MHKKGGAGLHLGLTHQCGGIASPCGLAMTPMRAPPNVGLHGFKGWSVLDLSIIQSGACRVMVGGVGGGADGGSTMSLRWLSMLSALGRWWPDVQ